MSENSPEKKLEKVSKPFVNLHTHSFYSILESSMSPQALIDKAKSLGHSTVALTDTGVGYGLIEFYKNAEKSDINPILGVEMSVSLDSRFEKRVGIDGKEGSLVLLAKNMKGYENLLKIISYAALEGFYYKPRADFELLEKYSEGLIVLTGGTGGIIGKSFSQFGTQKPKEILDTLKKIFGEENIYLELISRTYEEQINLNQYILELHKETKIPLVVTSDARYANPENEEATDTLQCIGWNQQVSNPHRLKMAENNAFKSWEEISSELSEQNISSDILEEARKNTLRIAEEITLKVEFNRNLLPKYETEKGLTEAAQLAKNCQEGFIFRNFSEKTLGKKTYQEYQDRLTYELSIISKMGFDAYFLIVQDFIDFARKNDIAVGPGRGSAAGSIVSYLLGITNIDPIEYELLFERFLNPERISMPDIDIDFSDERRAEVLDYVIEKYGTEQVSKVCTFGTLAAKAALKDIGRAHGIDYGEMNYMTKILPSTPGFKLKDAMEESDFTKLLQQKPHLKKIYDLALELEGCVRHVSVHACAVMIGQNDLTNFCPIQWAPGAEEIKITQFQYGQLESIGLLKMDFLGLRNLSILEKAVQNIKNTTGKDINLDEIPINDEKTFTDTFAAGETTGVFQFESAGMRRYLKELKPTEFEDLVAMNALYRPGPMEYIPDYIRGKHDPSTVKYMVPELEPILKKTYGIAVYQEQVLRIARDLGGFTLGEADILRKAIGKKLADILEQQRNKLIEGCVKNGHPKEIGEKIFDDIIVPFSGYGFNRSHAVCYARIAYETAYLRANYPVEFMAALMTIDRNNTDRIVLAMNECADMGIDILPPSINESGSYFTVIKENPNKKLDLKLEEDNHPKVIVLSGTPGCGKSTVTRLLVEQYNYTHIEVDKIKQEMFGDEEIFKDKEKHLKLYDSFLEKSLKEINADKKIVIDYCSVKGGLEKIKSFFRSHKIKPEFFILAVNKTENLKRNKSREIQVSEEHLLKSLKEFAQLNKTNWKEHFVKTSNKKPEQIFKILSQKLGIKKVKKHSKKIRFGLSAIKGLGETPVDIIIAERNADGNFKSLQDLAKRVPAKLMNKKTLEALTFSGGLDEFGDRRAIVDSIEDLSRFAKEHQEKSEAGQMGLFGGLDDSSIDFALKNTVATKEDILKWERESLGMFVSDHPLKGLEKFLEKYGKPIGRINAESDNGKKITIHGIVTSVKKITTKAGQHMAILEVEDTSGKIECPVFPMSYETIPQKAFEIDAFVKVSGKVSDRNESVNFIVNDIKVGNLQSTQEKYNHKKPVKKPENNMPTSSSSNKSPDSNRKENLESGLGNTEKNKNFQIHIPQGTTKQKLLELKTLIKSFEDKNGSSGEIIFGEISKPISFRVNYTEELQKEIQKILG